MTYGYEIVRTARGTMCIEVTRDGHVIVRGPLNMTDAAAAEFISTHSTWVEKRLKLAAARKAAEPSDEELIELRRRAQQYIPGRVRYFAAIMGVEPKSVSINAAKTRFGSCGPKNTLNFSCRVMLYPLKAVDCVIVHELAHIRHHNHGPQFYKMVYKFMPDYDSRKRLLRGFERLLNTPAEEYDEKC